MYSVKWLKWEWLPANVGRGCVFESHQSVTYFHVTTCRSFPQHKEITSCKTENVKGCSHGTIETAIFYHNKWVLEDINVSAGYGYSHTEAPPLYTCTCALKRVQLRLTGVTLYIEHITIRTRAANKFCKNFIYLWSLHKSSHGAIVKITLNPCSLLVVINTRCRKRSMWIALYNTKQSTQDSERYQVHVPS